MKQVTFTVRENIPVASDTWRMLLEGDCSAITGSGQFVQLSLSGLFLRRPFSVSDATRGRLTIIYKVVGKGTAQMSALKAGDSIDAITGLGQGFHPEKTARKALLIGGSVGTAPLLLLARELLHAGKEVEVALGFNTASLVFYREEFERLGLKVHLATVDGTAGLKGVVTEAIKQAGGYDYYYCCGSKVMMKAVAAFLDTPGEFSMEERMGCGTGICYGCSINTTLGPRRVCADGPVFGKEVLLW